VISVLNFANIFKSAAAPPVKDGPADIYVRPSDLRIADANQAGIDVKASRLQRTESGIRAEVSLLHSDIRLRLELPHLHYDVQHFELGVNLRLRFMQFSIFTRQLPAISNAHLSVPILIGKERERLRGGGFRFYLEMLNGSTFLVHQTVCTPDCNN
jgi:hypothetical protein